MSFPRSSGILLHISSLPSDCGARDFGIGDLGPGAYRFVDFLEEAGQTIWQILPIGPSVSGNSPYSCYSAFAGNALFISPEKLIEGGYLRDSDVHDAMPAEAFSAASVNFDAVAKFKWQMLAKAFEYYRASASCEVADRFEEFCTQQAWWLDDFALFTALMKHFGSDEWTAWDAGLVRRNPDTLGHWRRELNLQVEFEQFVQYLFFSQWRELKRYANSRNVRLFGDMPIFVARGSADVWANQSVFQLDEHGKPTKVAGVPPDYFSKTGQLWGNPLYNWQKLAETGYRWWNHRFQSAFELYDLLRIDHFRGFESYWAVPADAKTAVSGSWEPGPGRAPFDAARAALGELPIVAEDLGMITEEVHELRDALEFPGMRILQFGFDQEDDVFHRPESYPENSAAYTGTHDNSTVMGWYFARQTKKPDLLDRYLQPDNGTIDVSTVNWQLMAMVMNSDSHTAIVPMQDALGLDDSARMNIPGQADGNWCWRVRRDQLTEILAAKLRVLVEHSHRLHSPSTSRSAHNSSAHAM